MKNILKNLLNKLGYHLITTRHFERMYSINQKLNEEIDILTESNIFWETDSNFWIRELFEGVNGLVFFDVGANIGQTTIKLKTCFPAATVYAFEPIRSTYHQLVEKAGKCRGVHLQMLALGSSPGEVEVFHQQHSQCNSLAPVVNRSVNSTGGASERVRVVTLDAFVVENGIKHIHFLKSDTEGFELEVLKGASNCLKRGAVDAIYVESGFIEADLQHVKWSLLAKELSNFNFKFCGFFEVVTIGGLKVYANALFIHKDRVGTLLQKMLS